MTKFSVILSIAFVLISSASAQLFCPGAGSYVVSDGNGGESCAYDCSVRYGAGCLTCTESACTAVDASKYWSSVTGQIQQCTDFGVGCLQCSETDGCTKTVSTYKVAAEVSALNGRRRVPGNGQGHAVPCNSDAETGFNCAQCAQVEPSCKKNCAYKCTQLVVPEADGGLLCGNKGMFCSEIRSDCKTCACNTVTKVPTCSSYFTAQQPGYYVHPKTGQRIQCNSIAEQGGYNNGCLRCNATECTGVLPGFTVRNGKSVTCPSLYGIGCSTCNVQTCLTVPGGSVIVNGNATTCASQFGTGCTACNPNGCTTAANGYGVYQGQSVPCSQIPTLNGPTTSCAFTPSVNDWECKTCTEGYICSAFSPTAAKKCMTCDERLGTNGCVACDAQGCTKAAPGKCLNSHGNVASPGSPFLNQTGGAVDLHMCRVADVEGCVLEITSPADRKFDLGGPTVQIDLSGTDFQEVLMDNHPGRQLAIRISYATGVSSWCHGDPFVLKSPAPGASPVYDVPMPACGCDSQTCYQLPIKVEVGTVNGVSQDFQQVNADQCPDVASCERGPIREAIPAVSSAPFPTIDPSYSTQDIVVENPSKTGKGTLQCTGQLVLDIQANPPVCVTNTCGNGHASAVAMCGEGVDVCLSTINGPQCSCMTGYSNGPDAKCVADGTYSLISSEGLECEKGVSFADVDERNPGHCTPREGYAGSCDGPGKCKRTVDPRGKECPQHNAGSLHFEHCDVKEWEFTEDPSGNAKFHFTKIPTNEYFNGSQPLCYFENPSGRPHPNNPHWKSPQACFCHRTCSATNPWVLVEADAFSNHCDGVTVGADRCCFFKSNGEPTCFNSKITMKVRALKECCASGNECPGGTTNGDPHLCTKDGTCFDDYSKGGPYRVSDMIFWDSLKRRSERVIVDSTFSNDRATYLNNVVIKRQTYQFSFNFLTETFTLEAPGATQTIPGSVVRSSSDVTRLVDNNGEGLLELSYLANIRRYTIKMYDIPHVVSTVRMNNRELNVKVLATNSVARKQFTVSAGLLGLTLPTSVDAKLTDIDRRRMRMDDMVDKMFWDNWVNQCLNRESNADGPCDTTPLTQLPANVPVSMIVNGVAHPLGPPESAFKGFLGDLSLYGYADLFPNNTNSASLKTAGVQRCFMGEFAMQWAVDYTGPNADMIQSRKADEHFTNCVAAANADIDALYSGMFGSKYPVKTNARRNADGEDNENEINHPELVAAMENGPKVLTDSCGVGPDRKLRCPPVIYSDGTDVLIIAQAERAPVAATRTEDQNVKTIVTKFGEDLCVPVAADGTEGTAYPCPEYSIPGVGTKDKYLLSSSDGLVAYVDAARFEEVMAKAIAPLVNRRRGVDAYPNRSAECVADVLNSRPLEAFLRLSNEALDPENLMQAPTVDDFDMAMDPNVICPFESSEEF